MLSVSKGLRFELKVGFCFVLFILFHSKLVYVNEIDNWGTCEYTHCNIHYRPI